MMVLCLDVMVTLMILVEDYDNGINYGKDNYGNGINYGKGNGINAYGKVMVIV